jgi:transposase
MSQALERKEPMKKLVVLDSRGDEERGGRVDATREGLEELLGFLRRRESQFVLEAGPSFLWVFDFLSAKAGRERLHVAQPHRVRPIANSLEKSDANDAWWLAYLCFEGRLPESFVAEGEVRELRIATRELRAAVERRSSLIRRFRAHLAQAGRRLRVKNFQTVGAREAARERIEQLEGMRQLALSRLLASIEFQDQEIAWWRERVEELVEELPMVATIVREMPGFGVTLASIVIAELGDPHRFRNAKAYASSTGLAPGYRQSGGYKMPVGMSRAGSRHARWAFTRAVIGCLRCQRGAGASVKYWVLRRSRNKPKRKVMVAAARKLAEGVWRLFALGECFDLSKAFPGPKAA